MKSFSWCPTLNIMAYWVAEDRDVPARVNLLEIPSRQELRSKNLFNVADCKMCWQKNGDYLAVKVDRFQKCKKEGNVIKYSGMYFNFEVSTRLRIGPRDRIAEIASYVISHLF